jgi:Ca-activated chloride channel homolog
VFSQTSLYWAALFCSALPVVSAELASTNINIEPRARAAAAAPRSDFRSDATVVLVNVTVRDRANRLVTSLGREEFRLFENKVEQHVAYFAKEEVPVSIGVVFDSSGSMGEKIGTAREAIGHLLKSSNREDEFFLIQFSDRAGIVSDFTGSPEDIQSRLMPAVSKGRTSLLDGIYLGLQHMRHAKNSRKALIVVSDGGDNHSRYSESEIKNLTRESDVQIYAIGLFEPVVTRERSAATLRGPALLEELAQETGGRHYPVKRTADLPDIALTIGSTLRHQYLLGYTSTDLGRDGKYRKVQIKVNPQSSQSAVQADWKRGYYAPGQAE